jgi:outer membrane protein assembly factor BamD
MKRKLAILAALVLLSASACSLRKHKPTDQDYFAQAQWDFANKEYKPAIENYQKLIDEYPFSPDEEEAELKIGLAYYQQKDYAEAIASLDDFQRMHPTSKELDLVTYYIAMSYYDQVGREDQDQSKTEAALKRFEEIEQRFPEGSFDELAHEHIAVCREMLARHQMVVGDYYYKRANFRAAESRFAELMQKYPDTPVAPDALWDLAIALQKEGKKYSAAQAFAALEKHFPNSPYALKARTEIRKLHEPVDTEEDPLPIVLAETGYPSTTQPEAADQVPVRQRAGMDEGGSTPGYGPDGLPLLAANDSTKSRTASDAGSSSDGSGMQHYDTGVSAPGGGSSVSGLAGLPAGAAPPPSAGVASELAASGNKPPAAGESQLTYGADAGAAAPPSSPPPSGNGSDMLNLNAAAAPPSAPNPNLPTQVAAASLPPPPPEPSPEMHQLSSIGGGDTSSPDQNEPLGKGNGTLAPTQPIKNDTTPGANTALAVAPAPEPGPATLKTIRLSSNDPPLTVIFDLTGPVSYSKEMEPGSSGGSKITVVLKDVTPDASIGKHVVFDRSIFKDCMIMKDSTGTTIVLNMQPIQSYSVVPLDDPARLLVTFTPQNMPGEKTSSSK